MKTLTPKTAFALSAVYFTAIGLWNLVHTLVENRQNWIRDAIILVIMSSPWWFPARLYRVGFGVCAAVSGILLTFIYGFLDFPKQLSAVPYYSCGLMLFTLVALSGMGLIYGSTVSKNPRMFRIV